MQILNKYQRYYADNGLVLQEFDLFSPEATFAGKKPVLFMLKNRTCHLEKASWKCLYVNLISALYAINSYVVRNAIRSCLFGSRNELKKPESIASHMFLETSVSIPTAVKNIATAMNACNINLGAFHLACIKKSTENEIASKDTADETAEDNKNVSVQEEPAVENEKNQIFSVVEEKIPSTPKDRYALILEEYFAEDGYKLGSFINRGRFEQYYSEKFGCEVPQSMLVVEMTLSRCGERRGDRIFPVETKEEASLIDSIVSDIDCAFNNGASAVYIEAVYLKYKSQLAESLCIYDADIMADILVQNSKNKFYKRYSFFCVSDEKIDLSSDIRRVMKNSYIPLSYDELHEKVWYIPYDKMKLLLVNDKSIVWVAPETYFYAPNLPFANAENLAEIVHLINEELQVNSFVLDEDLKKTINERMPNFAMNLHFLTAKGLYNCLSYLLRDCFSFEGTIVSKKGTSLNLKDSFVQFVRMRDVVSFEDLKFFANEMKAKSFYWNDILNEVIRISDEQMVRKANIPFDIDAIDDFLERLCTTEYMPLKEINLYLQFPPIGYRWNEFVLEGYLYCVSRKFKLLHSSFTNNSVAGAIVKRESSIATYPDLLIDVLSKSDALSSPQEALEYLVEKGYQQRRRYEGIEMILQKAITVRNKRLKV